MGRPATLPTVAAARPDLALDWHPDNTKTPDQVSIGAKYRALWKCRTTVTLHGTQRPCAYEWPNTVQNRARAGQGCPACAGKAAADWNNLAILHPDLTDEWAPTNTLTPTDVTPGSGYIADWTCRDCGHNWPTTPDKRTGRGDGCPACNKYGVASPTNNLTTANLPHLIRDWHPTKNHKTPDQYRPKASQLVWWKCHNPITFEGDERLCGYEWERPLKTRAAGVGCPACTGFAATDWNNLAVTHPHLVLDWHEDNELRPEDLTKGKHTEILWRCRNIVDKFGAQEPCGYEWETEVYQRASGKGCPACSGNVVTEWNNLAARHPRLLAQWSPRNAKTAAEVTPGTDFHAEWICDNTIHSGGTQVTCGHRWKTKPNNRILGNDCPECMLWATSKDEIHLAHELSIFFTVDNTGLRIQGTDQKWKVDIAIPDLHVIVEYDGSYWHRDKTDRDTRKSHDLTTAGWTVIRAREHPLEALTPTDVLCRSGQHKTTANAVLQRIQTLTGTPIEGLDHYLAQTDPQNRQAAQQRMTELRANVLANRAKRAAKRLSQTTEAA